MKQFKKFLTTRHSDMGLLVLRLGLGIVILAHGLQKTFGWFDGPGFPGAMNFLVGLGIPAALAILVVIVESIGSLSLIFGFLTRFCAASIGIVMLGAVLIVHAPNGFFMGNNGYEFHILAISIAVVLAMKGGGAYSLDDVLVKRMKKK